MTGSCPKKGHFCTSFFVFSLELFVLRFFFFFPGTSTAVGSTRRLTLCILVTLAIHENPITIATAESEQLQNKGLLVLGKEFGTLLYTDNTRILIKCNYYAISILTMNNICVLWSLPLPIQTTRFVAIKVASRRFADESSSSSGRNKYHENHRDRTVDRDDFSSAKRTPSEDDRREPTAHYKRSLLTA